MEATATGVAHISELDALVAVDRCGLPEISAISDYEGHPDERANAP